MKKIILPSALDIEKVIFLSENKYRNIETKEFEAYNFDLKTLNIQSIQYIIYLVFQSTINSLNSLEDNKRAKYYDGNRFIYNDIYIDLPSTMLAKIDRDYKNIMSFLCNNHLYDDNILYRSRYKRGKSFSYKLNYNLISSSFQKIDINKKSILSHIKNDCKTIIECNTIKRNFLGLKNDFTERIKINIDQLPKQLETSKIISEYNSVLNLIQFYNGKKWMTLSNKKDGRLHSNFTTMKSKHRVLITNEKQEKFVEIDISSSIPFFFVLSIVYCDNIELKCPQAQHLLDYQKLFGFLKNEFKNNGAIELLKSELTIIIKAIIEGNFYELFVGLDKKSILSFFFCENNSKPHIENAVKLKFPNFHYFVSRLKDDEFWIKNFGYPSLHSCNKLLAHYLFHLESTLILYKICKRIKKTNKNIEIITIHDCLLVTEKYAEVVKKIMEDEFKEIFRISPQLKIKSNN